MRTWIVSCANWSTAPAAFVRRMRSTTSSSRATRSALLLLPPLLPPPSVRRRSTRVGQLEGRRRCGADVGAQPRSPNPLIEAPAWTRPDGHSLASAPQLREAGRPSPDQIAGRLDLAAPLYRRDWHGPMNGNSTGRSSFGTSPPKATSESSSRPARIAQTLPRFSQDLRLPSLDGRGKQAVLHLCAATPAATEEGSNGRVRRLARTSAFLERADDWSPSFRGC